MRDSGPLIALFSVLFTGFIVLAITQQINWQEAHNFWNLYEDIIVGFAAIAVIAGILYEVLAK